MGAQSLLNDAAAAAVCAVQGRRGGVGSGRVFFWFRRRRTC
ncbi:hypothetical protein BDI4_380131 [Burkholderia diffusa]|nr:hypothetical protein BDI4_380131 [Burkholderia diffusa]